MTTIFAAIKAGALGYLLKETSPRDLLQAIRVCITASPRCILRLRANSSRELNRPSTLPLPMSR